MKHFAVYVATDEGAQRKRLGENVLRSREATAVHRHGSAREPEPQHPAGITQPSGESARSLNRLIGRIPVGAHARYVSQSRHGIGDQLQIHIRRHHVRCTGIHVGRQLPLAVRLQRSSVCHQSRTNRRWSRRLFAVRQFQQLQQKQAHRAARADVRHSLARSRDLPRITPLAVQSPFIQLPKDNQPGRGDSPRAVGLFHRAQTVEIRPMAKRLGMCHGCWGTSAAGRFHRKWAVQRCTPEG